MKTEKARIVVMSLLADSNSSVLLKLMPTTSGEKSENFHFNLPLSLPVSVPVYAVYFQSTKRHKWGGKNGFSHSPYLLLFFIVLSDQTVHLSGTAKDLEAAKMQLLSCSHNPEQVECKNGINSNTNLGISQFVCANLQSQLWRHWIDAI